MEPEKKSQPRGYAEISKFIDQLSNPKSQFFQSQSQSPEEQIEDFLESAFRRRLSVVKGLLKKLEECKKNDYKTSLVTFVLSKCDAGRTREAIIDCIKQKSIDDLLRKRLLLVLEVNENISEVSKLMCHFSDKETVAENALKSVLSHIGPDAENLDQIAKYLEGNNSDFYRSLIANLTHRTDEQSVWLLGYLAEFPCPDVAETAIQSLGYRKSSVAYEILDNLIFHRKSKREFIDKSLERLAQFGISKPNYKNLTPHKCYLSWLDGYGHRMLLVSRKIGKGRLSMVTFILHDQNGFQDCSTWPDISNFEFQSMIKGWEQEVGLKQVDYSVVINIIEDCLWTILQNKQPLSPSFLSARHIFGAQSLEPKSYPMDFNNLGIEHVKAKYSQLLQNSDSLLQHFPFKEWWLDSPLCYEFVKSKRSLSQGHKIRQSILGQFIRDFFEKDRELFARRFMLTTDFMNLISPRFYREQIEICLAMYLALNDEIKMEKIPFMEQLGILTIHQIQMNLEKQKVAS